jgi:hypothetical protein
MYVLKTLIEIERLNGEHWEIDYFSDIDIDHSWADLTDKAILSIPLSTRPDQPIETFAETYFSYGDKVTVTAYYRDYEPEVRFVGYIQNVKATLPVVLECEDAMWLMNKFSMKKEFVNTTLGEVVNYVFEQGSEKIDPKYKDEFDNLKPEIKSPSTNLGEFIIEDGTGTQVFEELKKEYGLHTYVKDNIFHVGFSYTQESVTDPKEFVFEENILENNLTYKYSDDIQLYVKAISIMDEKAENGKNIKHTVEIGDPSGDLRTLHFHNVPFESLNEIALEEIEKYRYTGYRGFFSTFLHPYVEHSWQIKLSNLKVADRNGNFMVSRVRTKITPDNGGEQIVYLDRVYVSPEEREKVLKSTIIIVNEKTINL